MALTAGLGARVLLGGRACVPRARTVAAQPRVPCCPLAMANPFEDKKKEAAKRALMSALEGKKDVLMENQLKEAARLKAGGGSGGGGRSGGGGGGGSGDGGKFRREAGTTLQTFFIIVGAVSAPLSSPQLVRRQCQSRAADLSRAACALQHVAPAARLVCESHLCVAPVRRPLWACAPAHSDPAHLCAFATDVNALRISPTGPGALEAVDANASAIDNVSRWAVDDDEDAPGEPAKKD